MTACTTPAPGLRSVAGDRLGEPPSGPHCRPSAAAVRRRSRFGSRPDPHCQPGATGDRRSGLSSRPGSDRWPGELPSGPHWRPNVGAGCRSRFGSRPGSHCRPGAAAGRWSWFGSRPGSDRWPGELPSALPCRPGATGDRRSGLSSRPGSDRRPGELPSDLHRRPSAAAGRRSAAALDYLPGIGPSGRAGAAQPSQPPTPTSPATPKSLPPILFPARISGDTVALNRPEPWGAA